MKPTVWIGEDQISVNVQRRQFTDTVLSDFQVTPIRSDLGRCVVRPWGSDEIDRYYAQTERWEKYGQPVHSIAKRFGREVIGGVAGLLCARFDIPLHEPADRTCMIQNGFIDAGRMNA